MSQRKPTLSCNQSRRCAVRQINTVTHRKTRNSLQQRLICRIHTGQLVCLSASWQIFVTWFYTRIPYPTSTKLRHISNVGVSQGRRPMYGENGIRQTHRLYCIISYHSSRKNVNTMNRPIFYISAYRQHRDNWLTSFLYRPDERSLLHRYMSATGGSRCSDNRCSRCSDNRYSDNRYSDKLAILAAQWQRDICSPRPSAGWLS